MTSPAELIQTFRFKVDLTITTPMRGWPESLGIGGFCGTRADTLSDEHRRHCRRDHEHKKRHRVRQLAENARGLIVASLASLPGTATFTPSART